MNLNTNANKMKDDIYLKTKKKNNNNGTIDWWSSNSYKTLRRDQLLVQKILWAGEFHTPSKFPFTALFPSINFFPELNMSQKLSWKFSRDI
jgi:hypothetical protein